MLEGGGEHPIEGGIPLIGSIFVCHRDQRKSPSGASGASAFDRRKPQLGWHRRKWDDNVKLVPLRDAQRPTEEIPQTSANQRLKAFSCVDMMQSVRQHDGGMTTSSSIIGQEKLSPQPQGVQHHPGSIHAHKAVRFNRPRRNMRGDHTPARLQNAGILR